MSLDLVQSLHVEDGDNDVWLKLYRWAYSKERG